MRKDTYVLITDEDAAEFSRRIKTTGGGMVDTHD